VTDAASVVPTLSVTGLQKSYGPTVALGGVDLTILPGEVHAILGENGAGKSTLVKILSGVVAPDSGTAALVGSPYKPQSILHARAQGDATVVVQVRRVGLLPLNF
jgi:ribose transport system ATP-binding protein